MRLRTRFVGSDCGKSRSANSLSTCFAISECHLFSFHFRQQMMLIPVLDFEDGIDCKETVVVFLSLSTFSVTFKTKCAIFLVLELFTSFKLADLLETGVPNDSVFIGRVPCSKTLLWRHVMARNSTAKRDNVIKGHPGVACFVQVD